MVRHFFCIIAAALIICALPDKSAAQAAASSGNPCPRLSAGAIVPEPVDLFSRNGILSVNLSYNTALDSNGNPLFCFTTPSQVQSPTLHVHPGDNLVINVTNNLPAPTSASSMMMTSSVHDVCGAPMMDDSSVNIHYHGTNTAPTCHSDEVIHTFINSGQTFTYNVHIPADEPPGLYWYHPHVHGISEVAVQGGASGAIVVEGIQNIQPAVAGLPERVLVMRDQIRPGGESDAEVRGPSWDLSVNYVPILFPKYTPALMPIKPGQKQFWRVVNASADTILDLQLRYDGTPQILRLVALDGVAIDSQNGTARGGLIPKTDILIPPAGRAEFIMTGPPSTVKRATLITLEVPTGPDGDIDPARPIILLQPQAGAADPSLVEAQVSNAPGPQRFASLSTAAVTKQRTLYFSENGTGSQFFITVAGAQPVLFDANNPPAITTTQGSVEDWVIENHAQENHEFHIHQIHFLLMRRNGTPVNAADAQMLDTVDIPFWSGSGPYPSVRIRLDFRGADVGDFVYHCHILEHEDQGMMAIIRVLPR